VRDPVAVDLEELAEVRARVRAPEAFGAEHDVLLAGRDERANLVRIRTHVVGRGDDRTLAIREAVRHVRGTRLLLERMQAVPAFDIETVAAQFVEARAGPDVGDDAELLLQQLRCGNHLAQDRAAAEQLHARAGFAALAGTRWFGRLRGRVRARLRRGLRLFARAVVRGSGIGFVDDRRLASRRIALRIRAGRGFGQWIVAIAEQVHAANDVG